MRGIPIFTFINKMDRAGASRSSCSTRSSSVLGIPCTPAQLADRLGHGLSGRLRPQSRRAAALRTRRVRRRARRRCSVSAPRRPGAAPGDRASRATPQLLEELALLDAAGNAFDRRAASAPASDAGLLRQRDDQLRRRAVPRRFVELAPPPRPARRSTGPVDADAAARSPAFVFKIQANMDPQHRDRIAFVRVCSGRFERGMEVAARAHRQDLCAHPHAAVLAQERTMVDEAFAGDILGRLGPRQSCASATRSSRTAPTARVRRHPALLAGALRRASRSPIRSSASSSRRASSSSPRRARCRSSSTASGSSATPSSAPSACCSSR